MRRSTVALAAFAALAAVPAVTADAAPKGTRPVFKSYTSPAGIGDGAGEPTLGIDPRTGTVLFQALTDTLAVTGFDAPGGPRWRTVSPLVPSLWTFDPILETDAQTGRTWVSQLDLYCSRMAYTDDAGKTWTDSVIGCAPGATFDHQTVGVGPFRPEGLEPLGDYPNAVYYCAQTVVTANCGTSIDGGRTFLPATVAYAIKDCDTAFGHLKTDNEGMVYLPPWQCGAGMGLARSADNGQTWQVNLIPGALAGDAMHPSVDAGAEGTVYFGYGGKLGSNIGGPAYAAVSRDEGRTWSAPARLGAEHRLVNSRFVTVVAGDDDRAAVAYLGSATPGDASQPVWNGAWHLYVSFTYDRGRTWTTVNATPGQPVQVGPICTSGTLCLEHRNLLDFIDSVVDGRGRVHVAIADGCPRASCTTADRGSNAVIVRQVAGRGLYRKYDGR